MARKDTLTLKDAKRAEAAGWIALEKPHRQAPPATIEEAPKPTNHQLLTEAAEALRKGEWDPAEGPYQPAQRRQHTTAGLRGPFPNHTEPPATITFGVKEAAAAAARKATPKPKAADRGDER